LLTVPADDSSYIETMTNQSKKLRKPNKFGEQGGHVGNKFTKKQLLPPKYQYHRMDALD